jgi:hypothetical protein
MSSESEVRQPLTISHFSYPPTSKLRIYDNKQMARLNYMTSRIRALLCKWGNASAAEASEEGAALWWWTGLNCELVRIEIFLIWITYHY